MPAKQLRDLKTDFPDTNWYGGANISDAYNGNHHNFVDSGSGLRLQERSSTGKFLYYNNFFNILFMKKSYTMIL